MATEDSLQLNSPTTPGGRQLASTTTSDNKTHVHDVMETMDASGEPIAISPTAPMPVITRAATSTTNLKTSATSSAVLLASNPNRKGYKIYNAGSSVLYVKEGATASSSDYTYQLRPDDYYETASLVYTGVVSGVWASTGGTGAMVSEAL